MAHASKWTVKQPGSGVSADQTSFLTAPEAAYTLGLNGEKVYRSKIWRSYHPTRFIGPIETMRYSGIRVPFADAKTPAQRTTTVHLGAPNDVARSMQMHVLKRVKIVVRCPAMFHEQYFPPLRTDAAFTSGASSASGGGAALSPNWISRINAWGALMLKCVSLHSVEGGGQPLTMSNAEFVMVRKYCLQKEGVCAELLGKMPLMQETDTLQIETGEDVEFVFDADLPCSQHTDSLLPVCLLPQGIMVQLEWRRFDDLFITSDNNEYGAPRPFVIDAQTGRLRALEPLDLTATLEVQCHRIDEAQIAELRARASGPHGLNYKVVQPMLVGEKVILLQNDAVDPRERELLVQAANDAHDLMPVTPERHDEKRDFADNSLAARTYDIPLLPSVGMCRGYITSYQLLHHRMRKNWLLYSGAILGEPTENEVPTRTDPIDAIGLVRAGVVQGNDLTSAERARTEGFSEHSAQQTHTNGFFYAQLFGDDWNGYDFDVSLEHAPQEQRAMRIVRRVGTTSGVVRVWGLFEDKLTFQLSTQGVMTVRSSFAFKA